MPKGIGYPDKKGKGLKHGGPKVLEESTKRHRPPKRRQKGKA